MIKILNKLINKYLIKISIYFLHYNYTVIKIFKKK